MRTFIPILALAGFTAGLLPLAQAATPGTPAAQAPQPRRLDLADAAAGTYYGDVVSDVRAPTQSDVVVTVKRVAKNVVEVSCDYDRVPTVRIALTAASNTIMSARPGNLLRIDRDGNPKRLDLSIDQATLVVFKQ